MNAENHNYWSKFSWNISLPTRQCHKIARERERERGWAAKFYSDCWRHALSLYRPFRQSVPHIHQQLLGKSISTLFNKASTKLLFVTFSFPLFTLFFAASCDSYPLSKLNGGKARRKRKTAWLPFLTDSSQFLSTTNYSTIHRRIQTQAAASNWLVQVITQQTLSHFLSRFSLSGGCSPTAPTSALNPSIYYR